MEARGEIIGIIKGRAMEIIHSAKEANDTYEKPKQGWKNNLI